MRILLFFFIIILSSCKEENPIIIESESNETLLQKFITDNQPYNTIYVSEVTYYDTAQEIVSRYVFDSFLVDNNYFAIDYHYSFIYPLSRDTFDFHNTDIYDLSLFTKFYIKNNSDYSRKTLTLE